MMLDLDEEALICDLAETYGIYDYKSMPLRLISTLASGLRADSRIMLRISKDPEPRDVEVTILGAIADRLAYISYILLKAMKADPEVPVPIIKAILEMDKKQSNEEVLKFNTSEELDRELKRLRGS